MPCFHSFEFLADLTATGDEVLYLLILYDIYSEEYHGLPDAELKYRFLQYIGVVQAAGSR